MQFALILHRPSVIPCFPSALPFRPPRISLWAARARPTRRVRAPAALPRPTALGGDRPASTRALARRALVFNDGDGTGHWNATVEGLASNVMKMYTEFDPKAFAECKENWNGKKMEKDAQRKEKDEKWKQIELAAKENRKSKAAVTTL